MDKTLKDGWGIFPLLVLLLAGFAARGTPPDATTDYIDTTGTYNLGPTGARGWIYTTGSEWSLTPEAMTYESRQILIVSLDPGTPAWGVLQTNDVILGIGSTLFTSDARKAFGMAITEAEKTANAGQLKLKVWRSGVTYDNLTVTLPVMGSYSDTAPYECPKSALILSNACNYMASQSFSASTEGNAVIGLALLAAGRAQDVAKVQAYARSIVQYNTNLTVPLNAMVAWPWGYNNTFLSEYYLATGDTNVLPAIRDLTITSALGQSWCGTYGHGMAWPKPDGSSPHGIIAPYGAVNQAGLLVSLGIILGEKCGITNSPEVAPAIERSRKYYGTFAGKGAIPYGEDPAEPVHDDNGKNGEGTLVLALQRQADMSTQVQYFVKSCVASYGLRNFGHSEAWWAQMWPPLAANFGGTNAVAGYFKAISWELDLARRPNGSFAYNHCGGGTVNAGCMGLESDTAKFILTYATALKKIYITGKNSSTNNWIGTNDVNEAVADGVSTLALDVKTWSTNQLMDALSTWSPYKRDLAAGELATRAGVSTLVPALMTMAEGTNVCLRMGAVRALTIIQDARALPVLARRLNDSDYHVRWLAVGGYNGSAQFLFKAAAQPILTNMLSTIISNALPVEPVNWDEPCQNAQTYLARAVFNGQLAGSVSGVPTNLLYPAIATMSRAHQKGRATLAGFFNGNALQNNDVVALAPLLTTTLMDGFTYPDFTTPNAIVNLLARYYYDEGIAAAMLFPQVVLNRSRLDAGTCLAALQRYRSAAMATLPTLYYWNANCPGSPIEGLVNGQCAPTIAVIENDRSAPPALQYFKKITSASVAPLVFTNPVSATTLRASGYSITGDPVTYIWSKVRGAGPVTFSPNCTGASSNSTATFTIPGSYVLRLTVADAFIGDGTNGFGGISTNFTVTFKSTNPQTNYPPTANSQSVTMDQDTTRAITLTGTDPEGYEIYYSLASYPTNGTLSGQPPNLTYKPVTLFSGTDSFSFNVMDSEGQVSSNASVSISVVGYNHVPVALNRSLPVTNNTPTAIVLDASDVDGDALAFTVVTRPAHGLLTGFAPNLIYTPATNYNGVDSFTFKVNDGLVDSTNIATVTLTMGTVSAGIYSEFFQQPVTVNGWADMANLVPSDTRVDTQMSISHDYFPTNYEDHFFSRHIAFVKVPTQGNYTFTVGADDNTRVYVDEALVIQQFFPSSGSCTLQLTPGYHGVRLEFQETYGDNYFNLYWSGPGIGNQLIPASAFFRCVGNSGPLPPTGLKAAPANATVLLGWTGSQRATAYSVKRSLVTGGPYVTIATNVITAGYTDTSVVNGTTYYYVVSATGLGPGGGSGEGLNSTEAYATPVATVVINMNIGTAANATMNGYASSNTNAWGSASQAAPVAYVGTTWNDYGGMGNGTTKTSLKNSTNGTTSVGFMWGGYFTAGPWADWTGLGTARYLVSGLIGGAQTSYTAAFTLTGLAVGRNYDLYIPSLHNTEVAPVDFAVGTTTAHVATAGATDWTAGQNYVRLACLSPAADGTMVVNAKASNSSYIHGFQLVDVGLQAPGIPTGLSAAGTAIGGPHVTLSWTAPSGATSFMVKRALSFDGAYTALSPATGTSYTDYAVADGGTYYYVVSAINSTGESGNSMWSAATAGESSAKDMLTFSFGALGAASIAGTSITIALPYGTPVTNLAPSFTISPLATATPVTRTSRDFTTPQTYTITAQDLSTKVYTVTVTFVPSITSASLNVTATGTGSEIATNGTLLAAIHVGSGAVAPVTLVSGLTFGTSTASLTGYSTGAWGSGGQRTDTDAQGLVPALAGTNDFQKLMRSYDWGSQETSQMAIPGLVVGRLYRLQLISASPRAVGVSLEGGASVAWPDTYVSTPSVMTAVWMASDTTANVVFTRNHSFSGAHDNEILITGYALHDITPAAPLAPGGLTATGTNAQVNLSWTASSGATGYSVRRSLTNGGPYSILGGTAGVTYADSVVTNGTWYYYVVVATNNAGASAFSTQASARPLAPVTAPVLATSGVKLTNGVPSFTFTAAAGCKYRLDFKNALTDAVWTLGAWSTNAAGTPAPLTLTDGSAAGQPQRFYRIEGANP